MTTDTTPEPLLPPATIGILGGGQLGRMLGFAARAMGYRIVVLDPDPECPAAAVADRVVVGAYDDADAALELAADADVVTYELEHVALDVVRAIIERTPVRPGIEPLRVTQDRLAERRFVERAGIAVAPWRAVATTEALASAASDLGTPLRLKAPTGGYDGRSQVRVAGAADIETAIGHFGRPEGAPLLAERELDFEAELSVIVARGMDGMPAIFPPARNLHDAGILVESVTPADLPAAALREATAIALNLAAAMDLVGTLTVELFLLRDGSLVVNELAPRVHNSGHWTIEGAATSQFEQHVRAICGLPLGATNARGPTAIVNVLGTGPEREARLLGVDEALAVPGTHLHLYDKRRVFERRKMGHVTALAATPLEALDRARAARSCLRWAERLVTAPRVGVVGGSRSDFPVLEAAVTVLDELGVPSELRVVSAHRTPDHLFRYAETAAERGIRVIIAGAGGAAHLPGMLAAKTTLPVIGVPIPTKQLGGLDSLLSIVQMPKGIPVATVAIGNATNAGLLAAAILAVSDDDARTATGRLARTPDRGRPRRPDERRTACRGGPLPAALSPPSLTVTVILGESMTTHAATIPISATTRPTPALPGHGAP